MAVENPLARGGLQRFAVGSQVADHAVHRGQRQHQRVRRVKDLFLVLLHILGIGQRQALHHGEKPNHRAQNPPDLGADQFGGIGVLLLRHDRRTGREPVRQHHEAKLS